jgi:Galactose oxidase-like, Early set domain
VPVGIGTTDGGIAKAVLLKLGATTHATDADQRSLELPVAPVTGGIQFTTPSNPNAAPPGYYMLFLVNSAGVPSVAKMIRLDTGIPAPSPVPVVGGGPGAGGFPAPKLKRLSAKVSFKRGKAILKLTLRTNKAFVGNVKLFPLPKGKSAKARRAAKKPIVSKSIKGRGGRNVVVVVRFSIKGKRFPLKLRMTIGLRDPRGGPTRVTTKGLLLKKRPKPTARILAKAK